MTTTLIVTALIAAYLIDSSDRPETSWVFCSESNSLRYRGTGRVGAATLSCCQSLGAYRASERG